MITFDKCQKKTNVWIFSSGSVFPELFLDKKQYTEEELY